MIQMNFFGPPLPVYKLKATAPSSRTAGRTTFGGEFIARTAHGFFCG